MEEGSWGMNHGIGILEMDSCRRNHGGGITEEESWRWNHGGGILEEASGRDLGAVWESEETRGGQKQVGTKNERKSFPKIMFLKKVTVSRRRDDRRCHQVL